MHKIQETTLNLLVEWINNQETAAGAGTRALILSTTPIFSVSLFEQDWGGYVISIGNEAEPAGNFIGTTTFLFNGDPSAQVNASYFTVIAHSNGVGVTSQLRGGSAILSTPQSTNAFVIGAESTNVLFAAPTLNYAGIVGANDLQHAPAYARLPGNWSTVSGGSGNIASGTLSTVIGGGYNLAHGDGSIAGGMKSVAGSPQSIAVGVGNVVAPRFAPNSSVIAGTKNTIDGGADSAIYGGQQNQIGFGSIMTEYRGNTMGINTPDSSAIIASTNSRILTETIGDNPDEVAMLAPAKTIITGTEGAMAIGAVKMSAIVGGYGSRLLAASASADAAFSATLVSSCGVFGGNSSTITATGIGSVVQCSAIVAGKSNFIEVIDDGEVTYTSAIIAGERNVMGSTFDSVIVGGLANNITTTQALVPSSMTNTGYNGIYANTGRVSNGDVIIGGYGNSINSSRAYDDNGINDGWAYRFPSTASVIVGGCMNKIAPHGGILPPASTALGDGPGCATIGGGVRNVASGSLSTIPGGALASTRGIRGMYAYATGGWSSSTTPGAAQFGMYVQRAETTTATTRYTSSAGSVGYMTSGGFRTDGLVYLPSNATYIFQITVAARSSTGEAKSWSVSGQIGRSSAGATAFVGTPSITTIAESAGASSWSVGVVAEATINALLVSITGAASTNIKWCSVIKTTEIML